jgi:hypothetical protein
MLSTIRPEAAEKSGHVRDAMTIEEPTTGLAELGLHRCQ